MILIHNTSIDNIFSICGGNSGNIICRLVTIQRNIPHISIIIR